MSSQKDLSICIVHWNSPDHLEKCLEAVALLENNLSVETIVVDNNSLPYTVAPIKEKFRDIRWVQNDQNRGLAIANNQAASYSTAPSILFLNPDVLINSEAINTLQSILKEDSKVGAVSCNKIQSEKGAENIFRNYPTDDPKLSAALKDLLLTTAVQLFPQSKLIQQLKLKSAMNLFNLTCFFNDEPFEVEIVWGACIMVRREAFQAIKGFDENFFYGAEDKDLCMRLRLAGWRIVFAPQVQVEHAKGVSISLWNLTERESLKTFSRLFLYKKHRGVFSLCVSFLSECIIHTVRCICDFAIDIRRYFIKSPLHDEKKVGLFPGLFILCTNFIRVIFCVPHPVSMSKAFRV